MTQILCNALGSAAAGVLVNLLGFSGGFSTDRAAHASPVLIEAFTPIALIGVIFAWRLGGDAGEPTAG